MKFFCIADQNSGLGFKLVGIKTKEVANRLQAQQALDEALALQDTGIILITESVADLIAQEIKEFVYQRRLPLVLTVPARDKTTPQKTAQEFLKEAIGISI